MPGYCVFLKPYHGNDHRTTRPAVGYSIRKRDTGQVMKYGETIRGEKRYSKKFYRKNNVRMIIEAEGSKKEMHQWQHKKIVDYKKKNNKRPTWNKSDY
ncbi:hypothetical protein ACQKGD_25185 [Peribacillus frigoritolerans]|uniref:hypothetical protein n=1 Tax=Peribacillus frigoritolerans TaxID=450367 RepID=UPI003CFBCA55